jgi:poly(3-hydroxybutyrate) depolymerase
VLRVRFVAPVLCAAAVVAFASCSGGSSGSVPPFNSGSNTQFPGAGPGTPPPTSPPGGATPSPTPVPTATPTPFPVGTTTPSASAVRLGSYHVSPQKIFVAGISSGGFFAVQMHVAHSATIKGAAIYAGGVYYCATGNVATALGNCGGETVNGQALYHSTLAASEVYLDQQSSLGTIDNESNLRGQPVYLWSGTKDSVVNPQEMADLNSEYLHYGTQVTFDNAFPADHGWESPDGEVPCNVATSPYMITCMQNGTPYDSVQKWMTLFFGTLNPRGTLALHGSLMRFDQTEFGASAANSMDTKGTVYVPQGCTAGATCGLVVAFHGCLQYQGIIGDRFPLEAGIDEWADTNNVIVLYPFAVPGSGAVVNPNGCWDWWGYDDPNYATKTGTQISIVYKMMQRIAGVP